ncbi:PIN domain nuclease [Bacteroidia bacterium]|nr:PIN domain nuclease [Bacteroidia bacterium]
MGLVKDLTGKKIFLDTAPLIYYIEDHPYFAPLLNELILLKGKEKCQFISSVITLAEVLVLPIREKKTDLAQKYEAILTGSKSIEMVDINVKIAKTTAQLRAKYILKTPDAIQLASAIHYSADYFLTNDKHLKTVGEIKIITLEDL